MFCIVSMPVVAAEVGDRQAMLVEDADEPARATAGRHVGEAVGVVGADDGEAAALDEPRSIAVSSAGRSLSTTTFDGDRYSSRSSSSEPIVEENAVLVAIDRSHPRA